MAAVAPQHSDLDLIFDSLNVDDFNIVDNLIFSIAKSSPSSTPVKIISQDVDPSRFVVDNVAKSVVVTLLAQDINNDSGKFFMNLYVESGGKRITHLTKELNIQKTVNYEAP